MRGRSRPSRRAPGLLLLWALAATAPGEAAAVADGRNPPEHASTQDLAGPTIGFETLLSLLPPGARTGKGLGSTTERPSPRGTLRVEEIDAPDGMKGGRLRVEYSTDPELEERLRNRLAEGRVALGHVILMDPSTGEIYAYVSTDPKRFPATRAYPMASLMKIVTGAAVLRHDPKAASRPCRFVGSRWELHAEQLTIPPVGLGLIESFRTALANSNNPCFARFAVHDLGKEPLLAEMRTTGLLDTPGPLHAAGHVDAPSGVLSLGHLGSGMAGAFITPLAAARLAAALARGELVEPYWIAEVRDAEGALLPRPAREAPRRVWEPPILEELRLGMTQTTESGTAANAFRDPAGRPLLGAVRVAGKTGTVSGTNPRGRYQWFIGVAPVEAPSVAVATVVVDDPPAARSASQVAADALQIVFCEHGGCKDVHAERLASRSRAREREAAEELARRRPAEPEPRAPVAAVAVEADAPPTRLDQPIRPIGETELEFPRRLRAKKVDGRVVLMLTLSEAGRVLEATVDSSDLPAFNDFVTKEVKGWTFTPPRRGGRPVVARARLPIPIKVD